MKKILWSILPMLLVTVAAHSLPLGSSTSPGTSPGATPYCAVCGNNGVACYANYGQDCAIPNGMTSANHCTDQQAHDWCPGWAELFPNRGVSTTLSSL